MEKKRCVKMDRIMKNMLIHALRDVFREEKTNARPYQRTAGLILKLADHEEGRLYLEDEEYQIAVKALNKLRDAYINDGRYTDGIDIILMKVMQAKYRRCAMR